jgi:hypothetical protein
MMPPDQGNSTVSQAKHLREWAASDLPAGLALATGTAKERRTYPPALTRSHAHQGEY